MRCITASLGFLSPSAPLLRPGTTFRGWDPIRQPRSSLLPAPIQSDLRILRCLVLVVPHHRVNSQGKTGKQMNIRVVYGLSAVKKSVHCDMMKVLAAAVLEIRYAAEPCSKLDRMHGMCPPFDKRMVEREGIPGIEVQDVYELQPGYICIGRLIFVLVKERIAEIQPVTLRCLNISEPSALLQCNCHECIAKWCINGRLNASVKCWALDKDHKRKLRLSPETGVHEALENMTVDYLTNKGSALSYLELYELLNYISILSVQSYRRGEREVMSRAIESIAIKISMFVSLRGVGSFGGSEALFRRARAENESVKRASVKTWLAGEEAYSLHKPVRRRFKRRSTVVNAQLDYQWQADIISLQDLAQHNDGAMYILTVIDVLSKYAYAAALNDKSGTSVTAAFKDIFASGRVPQKLQTDAGKEFLNKHFQKLLDQNAVQHFVTHTEVKAAVVERFNRTLKSKMWRYFTANNTYRYVDVLKAFIDVYNATYHRTIKMAPVKVTRDNSLTVWRTVYGGRLTQKVKKPDLKEGAHVRVSKLKGVFTKGYQQTFSDEIFIVESVQFKEGVYIYRLKDYAGEEVSGVFYTEELQEVPYDPNRVYRVEKVLKRKGSGARRQALVKWRGWPEKFNSWVLASSLHGV
ncbi:hypothetical protein NDU88_005155 [Pleurodeles waltl]|uniref:Integrase catalytic domain-containing protein n=1 Tax=Pleurodeles waltl TaxID=8319 RepID=A0AAV7QGG8_PLEWA|nr:hypothetical protein NDU88_005155 [Pleurodeles waltl]